MNSAGAAGLSRRTPATNLSFCTISEPKQKNPLLPLRLFLLFFLSFPQGICFAKLIQPPDHLITPATVPVTLREER